MRITLELPDNTVSIKYCTDDGGPYPSDDKPVTLGMIVAVREDKPSVDGINLFERCDVDEEKAKMLRKKLGIDSPCKPFVPPDAPHYSEPHI